MENNSEPLSVPQFQEDRISKLPDDILVGILSILKLKEAAQTSVLSHRWLNLWTNVPRLHFVSTLDQHQWGNMNERKKYMHVFANWVNRALDSRRSSYLREFRIICDLDKCYQNDIDKWLEYASGMGVQMLELNLSRCGFSLQSNDLYNFPNQLLYQTTKLGVQLAPKVDFSCLRELYFLALNISGEAIECLLLKCPLLEDLRVVGSAVLVNLVVSGPSLLLKHLQITYCFRVESIKISDTNIVSLRVATKEKGFHLMLNNLPMLTEVWITGRFPVKSIFFSQLSCCLSQLTVMTLQSVCPETIMELYKFPELQNLRRLVLVVNCCGYKSLIGLTSLIDSCPRLVEFALMMKNFVIPNLEWNKHHSRHRSSGDRVSSKQRQQPRVVESPPCDGLMASSLRRHSAVGNDDTGVSSSKSKKPVIEYSRQPRNSVSKNGELQSDQLAGVKKVEVRRNGLVLGEKGSRSMNISVPVRKKNSLNNDKDNSAMEITSESLQRNFIGLYMYPIYIFE